MRTNTASRRHLLQAALACGLAAAAPWATAQSTPQSGAQGGAQAVGSGPSLDLLVRHTSVSLGADGVKRTAEFSERVHRRPQMVWIERVVPPHAHSDEEHAKGHKAHKHLDVAAAARWVTRDERGEPRLRLVSAEDKVVIDIARTDYGNVGFDGSWPAAWHLIDPAVLQQLKAAAPVGDTTTYTRQEANNRLTVVWNHKLMVPVSVESSGPQGSRKTVVQAIPAPATPPWTRLDGYGKKDFSDYLD